MIKKNFYLLVVISILCGCFSFAWGADRGEIHSGETKIGLEVVGPPYMDTWTFYGDAGDRVLISAQATSGSLWPRVNLYPPDSGPEEASNIEYLDHQLEQSGLYTIVIEDYALSNEGTYNITFLKIPGAVSSPEDPDGGSIASGQTLDGTINVASDIDAFQFYGDAGDRVLISAQATSGSLWPRVNLYPPDSGPEEASNIEYLDHQLEQSGLYTIVIEDYALSNEGTYNISLTKIPSTLRIGLYNPYPSNGSTINDLSGSFSWDPVEGATGYDLYFGEDVIEPLEKIGSNLPFPSMDFPEMEQGKVYYWHVVANTLDGDIEGPYWWFLVSIEGMPIPDIKANGLDGPLFVTPSESVDISISLDPGDMAGVWADWWGILLSSHGNFPLFGFQAPLFELPDTSLFSSPWPMGWYIFLFGLDDVPDGAFELDWYDYVVVVSQPAGSQLKNIPNFDDIVKEKMRELIGE